MYRVDRGSPAERVASLLFLFAEGARVCGCGEGGDGVALGLRLWGGGGRSGSRPSA